MIQITKDELAILIQNNAKVGKDIFSTHTRHKKYYLVESKHNLTLLNKIREGDIK